MLQIVASTILRYRLGVALFRRGVSLTAVSAVGYPRELVIVVGESPRSLNLCLANPEGEVHVECFGRRMELKTVTELTRLKLLKAARFVAVVEGDAEVEWLGLRFACRRGGFR